MFPMKIRKTVEVKARIDGRTKAELARLADQRELDLSDILREAIRELLEKERNVILAHTPQQRELFQWPART